MLLFSTSLCCLFRPVHSALWSAGKVEQAKQRALICWCSSWQFLGRWVVPVQRDVFIVMWFLLLFIQQFKITENQIKPSVNMRKLLTCMISCKKWYMINSQKFNLKALWGFEMFKTFLNSSWIHICFRNGKMKQPPLTGITWQQFVPHLLNCNNPLYWFPSCVSILFRPIIGHCRRRSCWSTAWWRLSGTPAPSSMTTRAALANTWRWSLPVEERWSARRYLNTCWKNPESSTRQCKYHFILRPLSVQWEQTHALMTAVTPFYNGIHRNCNHVFVPCLRICQEGILPDCWLGISV